MPGLRATTYYPYTGQVTPYIVDDGTYEGSGNYLYFSGKNYPVLVANPQVNFVNNVLFDGSDVGIDTSVFQCNAMLFRTSGSWSAECRIRNDTQSFPAPTGGMFLIGIWDDSNTSNQMFKIEVDSSRNIIGTVRDALGNLRTITNGIINASGWVNHIALVYDNDRDVIRLFNNAASGGLSTRCTGILYVKDDALFTVGKATNGVIKVLASGIDEIRLSNIARYTGVFSNPTTQFITDAETVAYWKMDEIAFGAGGSGSSRIAQTGVPSTNNTSTTCLFSTNTQERWIEANPMTSNSFSQLDNEFFMNQEGWEIRRESILESGVFTRKIIPTGTWTFHNVLTALTADSAAAYAVLAYVGKRKQNGTSEEVFKCISTRSSITTSINVTMSTGITTPIEVLPNESVFVSYWVRGRGGGSAGVANQTITLQQGALTSFQVVDVVIPGLYNKHVQTFKPKAVSMIRKSRMTVDDSSSNNFSGVATGTFLPSQGPSSFRNSFSSGLWFEGIDRGVTQTMGVDCGLELGMTGTFTLEARFKGEQEGVLMHIASVWQSPNFNYRLVVTAANQFGASLQNAAGGSTSMVTVANLYRKDRSYAVAISYDLSTYRLYVDGVLMASTTAINGALWNTNNLIPFLIGRLPGTSSNGPFRGVIDEVRLSSTARYVGSSYTVQTTPFVSDANTKGLWHLDSVNSHINWLYKPKGSLPKKIAAGVVNLNRSLKLKRSFTRRWIIDSSSNKNDGFIMGRDISEDVALSVGLFQGGCLQFFATTDLNEYAPGINLGPNLVFTGAFTVEYRIKTFSTTRLGFFGLWDKGSTSKQLFRVGNSSAGKIIATLVRSDGTNLSLTGTTTITNASAYAVAVCWDGSSNLYLFVNGILEASRSDATSLFSVVGSLDFTVMRASMSDPSLTSNVIDGDIDELRISNVCRYTSNYTPAASAFTNDANTKGLYHMENLYTAPIMFGAATLNRFSKLMRTISAIGVGIVLFKKTLSRSISVIGVGLVTLARKIALKKTVNKVAVGVVSVARILISKKSFLVVGRGLASFTRKLTLKRSINVIGVGVVTLLRKLKIFKIVNKTAVGIVSLNRKLTLKRTISVVGRGLASLSRFIKLKKTISLIGVGIATVNRRLRAFKSYAVTGVSIAITSRRLKLKRTFLRVGASFVTITRILRKTFKITGVGVVTLSRKIALKLSFFMTGKGFVTFIKAFRRRVSILVASSGLGSFSKKMMLKRTNFAVATSTVRNPWKMFIKFLAIVDYGDQSRTPDYSSYNQSGIIRGNSELVASPFTNHNNAFKFHGNIGDLIDCGNNTRLAWVGDFTFEYKWRFSGTVGSHEQTMGRYWPGASGLRGVYRLGYRDFDNRLFFSYANGNEVLADITGLIPVANTPYDLAICYQQSVNEFRFYVNGSLQNTKSESVPPTLAQTSTGAFTIGGRYTYGSSSAAMFGAVDEVRISDISRYSGPSYTPSTTPFVNDVNTMGLWHLDSRGYNNPTPAQLIAVSASSMSRKITFKKAFTSIGVGLITFSKKLKLNRTFSKIASGIANFNRKLSIRKLYSIIGRGIASLVRKIFIKRTISGIGRGFATLTRRLYLKRTISAISSWVVTIKKSHKKLLVVIAAGVVTLNRKIKLSRSITSLGVGIATLIKRVRYLRAFSAIGVGITTFTRKLFLKRSLTGTGVGLVTFARKLSLKRSFALVGRGIAALILKNKLARTILAAGAGVVTLNRKISVKRTISVIGRGIASVARKIKLAKVVLAISVGVVTLNRRLSIRRAINAVARGFATITIKNKLARTILTVGRGVATLNRKLSIRRIVNAVARGFASITIKNKLTRTILAVGAGVVTLSRRIWIKRTVIAVGRGLASIPRKIKLAKTIFAIGAGIATLNRKLSLRRTVNAVGRGLALLLRNIKVKKAVSAIATGISTLNRKLSLKRGISAVGRGFATLTRKLRLFRSVTAIGVGIITIKRAHKKLISAIGAGLATVSRKIALRKTVISVGGGFAVLNRKLSLRRTILTVGRGLASVNRKLKLFRLYYVTSQMIVKIKAKMKFKLFPGTQVIKRIFRFFDD